MPKPGLPSLCRDCDVSDQQPSPACPCCQEAAVPEALLCDLNRRVQAGTSFRCHAFRPPRFRVVAGGKLGAARSTEPGHVANAASDEAKSSILADRVKYQVALAVQRLKRDPEAVSIDLRYHLVWNTAGRAPVLAEMKGAFEALHDSFLRASDWIRGTAALMYFAPDHVHVYAESDGTRSIEAIVQHLKKVAREALRSACEANAAGAEFPSELWDKAYFSGTIG